MAVGYTSSSANLRSSFPSLLKQKGELRKIFYDELADLPDIYTSFCSVDTMDSAYISENVEGGREKWSAIVAGDGSYPDYTYTGEAAEYTFNNVADGTEIHYVPVTYRDAMDFSPEMVEDNRWRGIYANAREMAKGGKTIAEEIATDVLDNAFASGTGADGSYLCVTNHNLINSSSTGSNATSYKLSAEGLKQVQIISRKIVDDSNQYVNIKFDTLVVAPENEKLAEELVGSDKDPETANNAMNMFKGRYKVVVNPYLADPNTWFLVVSGDKNARKPRFYWRKTPQFKTDICSYSDNLLMKARERFAVGFSSWQHIIGSTGTLEA
jgi:hypothetical protein